MRQVHLDGKGGLRFETDFHRQDQRRKRGAVDSMSSEDDWQRAAAALDVAIGRHPEEAGARIAFRLAADIALSLPTAAPDSLLVRDCTRFIEPLDSARANLSRVIYFPTRPGQLGAFFNRLSFYVLFLRALGSSSQIAWLAFPAVLLGQENKAEIAGLVAAIDAASGTEIMPACGRDAVTIAFEPQQRSDATLHLGATRPTSWERSPINPDIRSYGLPLICIPSRSTTEVAMSVAPWSEPTHSLSLDKPLHSSQG